MEDFVRKPGRLRTLHRAQDHKNCSREALKKYIDNKDHGFAAEHGFTILITQFLPNLTNKSNRNLLFSLFMMIVEEEIWF